MVRYSLIPFTFLILFPFPSCLSSGIRPHYSFPDRKAINYEVEMESKFSVLLQETLKGGLPDSSRIRRAISGAMKLRLDSDLSIHLRMGREDGSSSILLDFSNPRMTFSREGGGRGTRLENMERTLDGRPIFLRVFGTGEILDVEGLKSIAGTGRKGGILSHLLPHIITQFPAARMEKGERYSRKIRVPLRLDSDSGLLVNMETEFLPRGRRRGEGQRGACHSISYRTRYSEMGKVLHGNSKGIISGEGEEEGVLCFSGRGFIVENRYRRRGKRRLTGYGRGGEERGWIEAAEETEASLVYDPDPIYRSAEMEGDAMEEGGAGALLRTIHNGFLEISKCYHRQEAEGRDTFGEVYINFTIDEAGRVSAPAIARDTVQNPDLRECLLEKVSKLLFTPQESFPLRVSYPLVYREGRLIPYPLILSSDPALRFPFLFLPPDLPEEETLILEDILFGKEIF